MLNLASKLIRKLNTSTRDLSINEQFNTDVSYSDHLIHDLKRQHQLMSQLYDQITENIEQQNFNRLAKLIVKLQHEFHSHTIEENTKVYSYLAEKFKDDACLTIQLQQQRSESELITQRFYAFVKKWQSIDIDVVSINDFHQEFVEIRYILVQRAQREEHSFYLMYQP